MSNSKQTIITGYETLSDDIQITPGKEIITETRTIVLQKIITTNELQFNIDIIKQKVSSLQLQQIDLEEKQAQITPIDVNL